MLICIIFTNGTSVLATRNNDFIVSDNLNSYKSTFSKLEDIINSSKTITNIEYIDNQKAVIESFIKEKNIIFNFDKDAYLSFEDISALYINSEDTVYTSITIPVLGSDYSLISNVTFLLFNNDVVSYTETLITKGINNKFVVDTYLNGALINHNNTDIDYMTNKEIEFELNNLHKAIESANQYIQTYGVGSIVGCLAAVLGVNAGIAALIANTCAAGCATLSPICVACIGAVGVVGAADVSAVVECFKL